MFLAKTSGQFFGALAAMRVVVSTGVTAPDLDTTLIMRSDFAGNTQGSRARTWRAILEVGKHHLWLPDLRQSELLTGTLG
jgi:hypothetical protein